jgi:hypothetical protein
LAFIAFGGFFEFLTPSISKGHNFLNLFIFWSIFNAPKTLIGGGVQVLFRHKKQWSPPLGFGLP